VWLYASAQVNEGSGPFSSFIRGYTQEQYVIRYGSSTGVLSKIQDASDSIARAVITEIISTGSIPSISTIADKDAAPVALGLFNGDAGGWAGNPLFLGLGYSPPLRQNILERAGDTYDALAMIKSAYDNQNAFDAAGQIVNDLWSGHGYGYGIFTSGAGARAINEFMARAYGGVAPAVGAYTNEIILGRIGNDTGIVGSNESEYMHGGKGDDRLLSSGGSDILDGGLGIDIADYSFENAKLNIVIKSVASTADYVGAITYFDSLFSSIDTLFGIEKIIGSAKDDIFQVQSLASHFKNLFLDGGGGKNDQLSGFYLNGVEINAIAGTMKSDGITIRI
jgi:RTX calcium-binding nonapeptide repeat (4 copies)